MKKILLIDDNADILSNTAEILALSGYQVEVAENGKIGIEKALEFLPDLIICDIMMPVLDGYGVFTAIHKNEHLRQIPFIFLSAKSDRTDLRKGMEMGADDYITKPFLASELLTAVDIRLKKEVDRAESVQQRQDKSEVSAARMMKELLEGREQIRFKKKQNIYSIGYHPHRVFYVLSGKIKVYNVNDSGKPLILELHGPGEYFGYVALLEGSTYRDTAEALEDCLISIIPKEDFLELVHRNTEVSEKFIKLLANNVLEKEQQLLNLAYNSLRRKVADALLQVYAKFTAADNIDRVINLSRDNLAAIAGTATESLIRTLSDFKQEKLIDIIDGNITLLNVKKLTDHVT